MLGYDERHPYPLGHRLARPYFSWIGYVLIVINVPILLVVSLMAIDTITWYPLLLPLLLLVDWFIILGMFLFNALKWGAEFRDRLTSSNQRRDGTDAISQDDCDAEKPDENMMRDRLLRLGNDQWIMAYLLIVIFWVLLFLTIFLWTQGLSTYSPIPSVFDAQDVMNYNKMKNFQWATIGLIGSAFLILMYTGSDFAYRQAFAADQHHMEEQGHHIPVNSKHRGNRFDRRAKTMLDHEE